MKKVGCIGPLVVVIFVFWLIGTLGGNSKQSSTPHTWMTGITATDLPTDPPPTPTPTKAVKPDVLELIVDDLGESAGTCTEFDTCTFVDITAVKTCKNASIILDLYDENDDNYDTDQTDIGTVKKGAHLHLVEVGTYDSQAWSVDAVDFTCG